MIYTIHPIPIEDEEYLRVLELVGKHIKEKKRDKRIISLRKKTIKIRIKKRREKNVKTKNKAIS
jgi:hypothetical protein